MKRILFFLLIFLIITFCTFSGSIINDLDQFSKLFPRSEGSSNEREAIRIIKERLDSINISNSEFAFSDAEGYHSFSSYIEADIPGTAEDTVITVIPVSRNYSLAAGLSLIEYYSRVKPVLTMKFLFLGAENENDSSPGSRYFLENYYPQSPAVFVYLNFDTAPSEFRIISGADGFSSPFMLFKAVAASLGNAGIPYHHSNTESILFRLSAAGTASMLRPYLAESYPAIELTGYKGSASRAFADEKPESGIIGSSELSDFYDALASQFSSGIPSDWDRHYLFGISEQAYLLIYILILGLLMIFPIFRRKHFGWYMRTLFRNLWFIPVVFGSVFIFLSFGSILISYILKQLNFSELWKYAPLAVFMFKISISIFMYSLAFKLIHKLPFSKKGSFYSISAILFLVLALFILTAIDLSLSFFALWPLFFIFLFTVFRKPLLKLIMLTASALWIIFVLVEIFALPSFTVIRLLTLSPVEGDLLSTLILIPFILAAIRLDMLSPPSKKLTRFLPLILGLLTAGLLLYILMYSPFSESNPQPVQITDICNETNGSRNISIESPAGLDSDVSDLLKKDIENRDAAENNIRIEVKTRAFLNRKIVNTALGFASPPEEIRISMYSDKPVTLFESSFPTEWLPSQKRLVVYIGRKPIVPLDFSLTLNRDAEINFSIEADFPPETEVMNIDGNFYEVRRVKTITKQYEDGQ